VLKVGATGDEAPQNVLERTKGPLIVLNGALIAAGAQIVGFMGFATTAISQIFRVGQGVSGLTFGLSLALAGAGHLVGISVGIAMLCGLLISWAGLMPMLTAGVPGPIEEVAETVFRSQVRFVGAGAIGVAAIWSLLKLIGPLAKGISDTLAAGSGAKTGAHDDRDIPIGMIGLLSLICLLAIGALLYIFAQGTPLTELGPPLVIGGVVFTVIVGAFIATVAGYMAGLIGASNSPVSGIGILAIVSGSLLLAMFAQPALGDNATASLVAYALFTVAIVFSIATISNDNLQDLKTGQLVGASPWRQQVALIVGVIAGSVVIGPVLDLLNNVYGFPGDPNRTAIVDQPLAAPQATLISSLARGVLNADLDWNLIAMGAGIGVAVIFIDEILGFLKVLRIPPLAVGIGMYLPTDVTTPVVLGAVIGYFYNRAVEKRENGEMAKRFGVLLACGFIVGESLLGILNAFVIGVTNNPTPIAIAPEGLAPLGPWIGLGLFAMLLLLSYLWVSRQSRPART
jgi:putative OPT family oligopeptide transporter